MLDSEVIRYLSIIAGTVLWDAGAVLQKKAIGRLPGSRLKPSDLLRSAGWMAGLVVTGVGWGMYVFGLDRVPVSVARTITGGSYVILALFSLLFLRTPLAIREWLALAAVSAGIMLLGLENSGAAAVLATRRIFLGIGCITIVSVVVLQVQRFTGRDSGSGAVPLFIFAALSGLLSSVGDLLVKVLLFFAQAGAQGRVPVMPPILAGAGLIVFYLAGLYMLSRAYQVGTMVGGVVVSDFFARLGAIFLGAVSLSEPLAGPGRAGALKAIGFLLVVGGSLLLGRFSAAPEIQRNEG